MENQEIAYLIKKLDNAIMKEIIKEMGEITHKPPGPLQCEIARYLITHQKEEVFQKDLENHLKVNRSTLSGILKTMEKNNMLISIAYNKDARMKKIELTAKTKEMHKRFQKGFSNIQKSLVKEIKETDLDNFYKVLNQINKNLETK